jgi:hypothetical protein
MLASINGGLMLMASVVCGVEAESEEHWNEMAGIIK